MREQEKMKINIYGVIYGVISILMFK